MKENIYYARKNKKKYLKEIACRVRIISNFVFPIKSLKTIYYSTIYLLSAVYLFTKLGKPV